MKWWLRLFREHQLSKSLWKVMLINLAICFIPLGPTIYRLLLVFIAAGSMFLVSIYLYTKVLIQYKRLDLLPNYGTYGYWLISLGGALFTALLALPTLLVFNTVANSPVNALSYALTLAFAFPVWTFFLVAKKGFEIVHRKPPNPNRTIIEALEDPEEGS